VRRKLSFQGIRRLQHDSPPVRCLVIPKLRQLYAEVNWERLRGEYGEEAANFIRNDFYVDDGLKSVHTPAPAVELVKNVKAMCHQGGFNLHKFLSKNKDVIKGIPESDKAEGVKEIDLDLDKLRLERDMSGIELCYENYENCENSQRYQESLTRCKRDPTITAGPKTILGAQHSPMGIQFLLILKAKFLSL